jgi:hypothetical protein
VGNNGKRAAALDLFFDFDGVGHNPRLSTATASVRLALKARLP